MPSSIDPTLSAEPLDGEMYVSSTETIPQEEMTSDIEQPAEKPLTASDIAFGAAMQEFLNKKPGRRAEARKFSSGGLAYAGYDDP